MAVSDSHLRRPLYEIERASPPTTVCMTGANGYVGSAITERLLAMGHTVHAAVIDADDEKAIAHLKELPGAERLKFFTANLQKKGEYDAPMAGCTYVIHNASPMILFPPKGKEDKLVVDPAVEGVVNVLESVDRNPTVKRVVLTSSVTAVVGDHGERGPNHIFTEEDWNLTSRSDYLPYHRSKTLAEKKAWEMAEGRAWQLVAICPSVIMGPPMTKMRCESVRGYLKQTVACVSYPFVPPLGWSYVDLADTAAAHTLAMCHPDAHGRYIIDSEGLNALQLAALLHPEYSQLKIPFLPLPYWATWLGILLFPKVAGSDLAFLECTYNKIPIFDTSKARKELGMEFFSVKKTMLDMTAALVKQGVVRLPSAAPKTA